MYPDFSSFLSWTPTAPIAKIKNYFKDDAFKNKYTIINNFIIKQIQSKNKQSTIMLIYDK